MTHSTMTRTTHNLTKYSRALISPKEQSQIQPPTHDFDWQHHTEPSIRILLEISRAERDNLKVESARLRVVCSKTSEHGGKVNLDNIIFEDIDLLSFSAIKNQPGLPIKVVYRDNMVGFRYLLPSAFSGAQSEYRRFQITFQNAADANDFINSIRDVCPCKSSNANSASRPLRTNTTFNLQMATQTPANANTASALTATTCFQNNIPSEWKTANKTASTQTTAATPHIASIPVPSALQPMPHGQAAYVSQQVDSMDVDFLDGLSRASTTQTQDPFHVPRRAAPPISRPLTPPPSSDDHSAYPTPNPVSTTAATIGRASPVPEAQPAARHPLIASLYDTPDLGHWSYDALEELVSHVIREDGFPQLVEKMDLMWRVKGFLRP